MIENTIKAQKQFTLFFIVVSAITFGIVLIRSYAVPFNHDEVATFFMYIQSGKYMPFHSQVDANNHVLNSFLGNICFHLFGSHPFSLRLPNALAFWALAFGTWKISKLLSQQGSKVFLTIAFLASFHWLSFFSACRGYGLSMALLVLGTAYLLQYISQPSIHQYFYASLGVFQLAISSNLILIIVVLLLSGIIAIIQLFNKQLFKPLVLMVWVLHFALIWYWLSFSFFLQENGALYYGEGESYWKVTFVSLIHLVFGFSSVALKWILIFVFLTVVAVTLYVNKNILLKLKEQLVKPSYSLVFLVIIAGLSSGFYIMHKVMGVNYPEDRTGLFFYVFFVLLICFSFDHLSFTVNRVVLLSLSLVFVVHFAVYLNFRKHSLNTYETIPEHFYTTLLNEQKKTEERLIIGGHRIRELIYGFFNYRHGALLNPADPVELMQMNCDYYLATRGEEKYFKPFYEIIDSEPDWGFLVLKRKHKMIKNTITELKNSSVSTEENEFMDVYNVPDTLLPNSKPLIAEINFNIEKIPVPANAWFVLQVNDSLDQTVYFKRYPLQWLGYDNNGKKNVSCSLISGNLPPKAKKIACFFWNIDKQPLSIKVNSLKIMQVDGAGVEYVIPEEKDR